VTTHGRWIGPEAAVRQIVATRGGTLEGALAAAG
jgi:hypothetical protein